MVTPAHAGLPRLLRFAGEYHGGESATLNWSATRPGRRSRGVSRSLGLTGILRGEPDRQHQLHAHGHRRTTATCSIAVTVTPGQVPRIIHVLRRAAEHQRGQSATLTLGRGERHFGQHQ